MERETDKPVVIVERESGLSPFFFGLAIGAGLALLFAPKSGEETRRELRNQGRRLRATAGEKAAELREMLDGGYEETKGKVEDRIAHAKQVIDEKRDGAKEAIEAGKAAVHSARAELEKRLSKARTARGRSPEGASEVEEDEEQ
jgi:gas vesicle protein